MDRVLTSRGKGARRRACRASRASGRAPGFSLDLPKSFRVAVLSDSGVNSAVLSRAGVSRPPVCPAFPLGVVPGRDRGMWSGRGHGVLEEARPGVLPGPVFG